MKPYERIADEIQKRIDRGDIAVGERVPSVREVAKKWKVAAATAAHALRELRERGVVRPVSRVGTIVTTPRVRAVVQRDRTTRDHQLTRDRIVSAAIEIADAEGLAALSLRGVAARVHTPVMSLYRHVNDKAELLRHMTDAAFGEEQLPAASHGWRSRVERAARGEWSVFRRHPWLARVVNLTRPEPLPNALRYADYVFAALAMTGANAKTQMRIHVILHGFVQGIALNVDLEAEAASETGLSDDEWMKNGRLKAFDDAAASGLYPNFGKLLGALGEFDIDFDDLFERGLAALLDGFEAKL